MTGIKFLDTDGVNRRWLSVALIALLMAPYLMWILHLSTWGWPQFADWLPLLGRACVQAGLSGTLALGVGFFLMLAAQGWSSRRAQIGSEWALLLPNLVPPLFLILALLSWVTPWRPFPYGYGAVIFAHVLLNAGLVAVALDRVVRAQAGGMAETAWLLGASRQLFWRRVGWPYLKPELARLFLFVFTLCFCSFSIPLMLGGPKLATLEVAIYEAIRTDGRWDHAVILAAVQSVTLWLLAWNLPRAVWPARQVRSDLTFLGLKRARGLVYVPALILTVGWAQGCLSAWHAGALRDVEWFEPLLTSLALGLSVGIMHLLLFLLVSYLTPNPFLERFLTGYLAASPAITGFALLLCPGAGEAVDFLKLSTALTLISFPLLYRWMVYGALVSVAQQVSVARLLGVSWGSITRAVVWPQVAPAVMRAAGLAALWASGDFALSGILAGSLHPLPLVMEGLMGNYQIEAAQVLMLPLALGGLGLYGLFAGASRYVAS